MGRAEELEKMKFLLEESYKKMAVPMEKIEFTRENYNKKFSDNMIKTPLGYVKIGKHQFEKLDSNSRHKYIGGMYQTLNDPIAIITQEDERGKCLLYTKSFEHKPKKKDGFISIVVNIDSENISISNHPKYLKNIIKNLKKTADIVYLKPINGMTAGADSLNRAISGNPQLLNNITQKKADVNDEKQ